MIELQAYYVCDICNVRMEAVTVPHKFNLAMLAFPTGIQPLAENLYYGGPSGWKFFGQQLICSECCFIVEKALNQSKTAAESDGES